jgi:hypothetical protein
VLNLCFRTLHSTHSPQANYRNSKETVNPNTLSQKYVQCTRGFARRLCACTLPWCQSFVIFGFGILCTLHEKQFLTKIKFIFFSIKLKLLFVCVCVCMYACMYMCVCARMRVWCGRYSRRCSASGVWQNTERNGKSGTTDGKTWETGRKLGGGRTRGNCVHQEPLVSQ